MHLGLKSKELVFRLTRISFVLLMLASCGGELTEVIVNLNAEEALRADAVSLRVELRTQEGEVVMLPGTLTIVDGLPGDGEVRFPARIPILPVGGDSSRSPLFQAYLYDADGTEISRLEAMIQFTEGEFTELDLTFEAEDIVTPPMVVLPDPIPVDIPVASRTEEGPLSIPLTTIAGQEGVAWILVFSAELEAGQSLGGTAFLEVGTQRSQATVSFPRESSQWRTVDWIPAGMSRSVTVSLVPQGGLDETFDVSLRNIRLRATPIHESSLAEVSSPDPINGSGEVVLNSAPPDDGPYFVVGSASLNANSALASLQLSLRNATMQVGGTPETRFNHFESKLIVVEDALSTDFPFTLQIEHVGPSSMSSSKHVRLFAFPEAAIDGFSATFGM